MEGSNENYRCIKIEAIKMYGGGYELDLYIKLSADKFLKISHRNEFAENVLEKYIDRGLTDVYLLDDDYHHFTNGVRRMLLERIQKATETTESEEIKDESIKAMSNAQDVMKSVFQSGRIDEESLELAKAVTNGTVQLIGQSNVMAKFKQFKKNCSGEYLHVIMTSYLANCMISTFSWANQAIQKKVTMAALMCDILLSPEEFEILRQAQGDIDKLSPNIIQHPKATAAMLASESKFIPAETLTIIEQHHEMPTGKGFPKGIGYSQITVLTSIYIIANYFIERMFDDTYREDAHADRIKVLVEQIANKFCNGNFRKAAEALAVVLGEKALD